ncbi:MAG: FliA/WhiG family RNA polymerase sigma factor [Alphaproteobacteria bacterium]
MAQAARAREARPGPGEDAAVALHLPLVHQVARHLLPALPPSVELDDLLSWGTDGLLDALRRFDGGEAASFRTYARIRIRGAILDQLRGLDWLSRTGRERASRLERGRCRLEQRAGRAATQEELAADLGLDLGELQRELGEVASLSIVSLDAPLGGAEQVAAPAEASDPAAIVTARQRARALRAAVDRLPGKERDVVPLYYSADLTMKQVGARLGVTESRVCQLHGQAIGRLREMLAGWDSRRVSPTSEPAGPAPPRAPRDR